MQGLERKIYMSKLRELSKYRNKTHRTPANLHELFPSGLICQGYKTSLIFLVSQNLFYLSTFSNILKVLFVQDTKWLYVFLHVQEIKPNSMTIISDTVLINLCYIAIFCPRTKHTYYGVFGWFCFMRSSYQRLNPRTHSFQVQTLK